MAPPARRARAEMSAGAKPVIGKRIAAAFRKWEVRIAEVIGAGGASAGYRVHKGVSGKA